jgi:3-dehydroquinate synthase
VIADATVFAAHGATLTQSLSKAGLRFEVATFPAGEGSKNIASCENLWQACASAAIDRAGAIVALGGGVSGDMAGFISATWMRGIDFIQIPTSLLAMVDSSVGGKTGVNSAAGKNLIGAFQQPQLVLIDPGVLSSMSQREYAAGLAEVVKYGIIYAPEFLAWQEEHAEALRDRDLEAVHYAVAESCRIKAHFVVNDEKEHGIRAHLNYGHTFGHALEKETGYTTLLHGEAVSIGMAMAAQAAALLGTLEDPTLIDRQNDLLVRLELPITLPVDNRSAWSERLEIATAGDKKVRAGQRRFILPKQPGTLELVCDPDRTIIRQAFDAFLQQH